MEQAETLKRTKDPAVTWLSWGILALGAIALIGIAGLWLTRRPAHTGGTLTACKSNLKNIGTACEMYSTDHDGKYPLTMDQLTPNYLKKIPACPATDSVTYQLSVGLSAPMNKLRVKDYYFVACTGANHSQVGVAGDYPAYNCVDGLVERAPTPGSSAR